LGSTAIADDDMYPRATTNIIKYVPFFIFFTTFVLTLCIFYDDMGEIYLKFVAKNKMKMSKQRKVSGLTVDLISPIWLFIGLPYGV